MIMNLCFELSTFIYETRIFNLSTIIFTLSIDTLLKRLNQSAINYRINTVYNYGNFSYADYLTLL